MPQMTEQPIQINFGNAIKIASAFIGLGGILAGLVSIDHRLSRVETKLDEKYVTREEITNLKVAADREHELMWKVINDNAATLERLRSERK